MKLQTIDLGPDVYITIPRGGSAQVLVNDGYEGLALVDCIELKKVGQIAFPSDAAPFPIHRWWIDPSGSWVILYSHEEDFALRLDLHAGTASRIAVPMAMGTPGPTSWFDPQFQLMTEDGLAWGIEDDSFVLQEPSASFGQWMKRALTGSRAFRRCSHFKADPGASLLYVLTQEPERIGCVSAYDPEVTLGPSSEGVVDFAWHAGRWLVGYHDRLEVHVGEERAVLELATNERLGRVNVIAHEGAERVVVLTSLMSNTQDRLLVGEIPAP